MSTSNFEKLDAADLIINLWDDGHKGSCHTCKKFSHMSVQDLKKKWNEDWGDFDYLVKKLLEGDEQFFDPDKSSSKTKQQIMDFVMRYNEKK